jgi:hypothetical protein
LPGAQSGLRFIGWPGKPSGRLVILIGIEGTTQNLKSRHRFAVLALVSLPLARDLRLLRGGRKAQPVYRGTSVGVGFTPVECGRSAETALRSTLAETRAQHYSRSHSRFSLAGGCNCSLPSGTPEHAILAAETTKEHEAALSLFANPELFI